MATTNAQLGDNASRNLDHNRDKERKTNNAIALRTSSQRVYELPFGQTFPKQMDWFRQHAHDANLYGLGGNHPANFSRFKSLNLIFDWACQNFAETRAAPGERFVRRYLHGVVSRWYIAPSSTKERAQAILRCYRDGDYDSFPVRNNRRTRPATKISQELCQFMCPLGYDGVLGKWAIDPSLPRRTADEFGHNGLEVGQWFVNNMQMVGRGAHGHSVAGIYGRADIGTYSILVSHHHNGAYALADSDAGDSLWYSTPAALKAVAANAAGGIAAASGDDCLSMSIRTGRAVRVIRKNGRYGPKIGWRYDGLYRVDNTLVRVNQHGVPYLQYHLVRLPDQPSLASLVEARPTKDEQRLYGQMKAMKGF